MDQRHGHAAQRQRRGAQRDGQRHTGCRLVGVRETRAEDRHQAAWRDRGVDGEAGVVYGAAGVQAGRRERQAALRHGEVGGAHLIYQVVFGAVGDIHHAEGVVFALHQVQIRLAQEAAARHGLIAIFEPCHAYAPGVAGGRLEAGLILRARVGVVGGARQRVGFVAAQQIVSWGEREFAQEDGLGGGLRQTLQQAVFEHRRVIVIADHIHVRGFELPVGRIHPPIGDDPEAEKQVIRVYGLNRLIQESVILVRVIFAQRFDVRRGRRGRRIVKIGGAGCCNAPRGGHGGHVTVVDRAQRLVHQRLFRGHRAGQAEDAGDFGGRDDFVVFIAERPAQNGRIVHVRADLLLQRGLQQRLHVRIEDVRMVHQVRNIIGLQHRQDRQVGGGGGPFAEARESPRMHPLDGQISGGGLPGVAAVFADHVPGVEGGAGDAGVAPVAVAPGDVVWRSLRRQRGEFPLAAGGGSVVASGERAGVQPDVEARVASRRDQPPYAVPLNDMEEACRRVLPARIEHAAPRIVAGGHSPAGQRRLLLGGG